MCTGVRNIGPTRQLGQRKNASARSLAVNGTGVMAGTGATSGGARRMPHGPPSDKRFAETPRLWHLAAMKIRTLLLPLFIVLAACSPAVTGTREELIDEDIASDDATEEEAA